MAIVVSKVDALVEMVKAYDNQNIKKSNKIGNMLSKSIQKDKKENVYNKYINLDRYSKELFPVPIRKNSNKLKINDENNKVEIILEDGVFEMEFEGEKIIITSK